MTVMRRSIDGMTADFIRANRSSDKAIALAVGISAFLLSFLGTLLFNIWADDQAQRMAAGENLSVVSGTLVFYLVVMLLACIAILMIIRNAFMAAMVSRTHQIGILATVGATPKQVRWLLLKEACVISALPIVLGITVGVLAGWALMGIIIKYVSELTVNNPVVPTFRMSPLFIGAMAILVVLTVLFAALTPARSVSKISPLDAVSSIYAEGANSFRRKERHKKQSRRRAESNMEWELATASVKARKLSLRSTSISLGLSVLVFTAFLSFITISDMSVKAAYYERFGIEWDYVANIPGASIDELEPLAQKLEDIGFGTRIDSYDYGARFYVVNNADNADVSLEEAMNGLVSYIDKTDFEIVDMEAEKARSKDMWNGYILIVGCICSILALIGISNVVSQTMCFAYQRKREFARYRAIGMTSSEVRKMLLYEGLLTVVRPLAKALIPVLACSIALVLISNQSIVGFAQAFPYGIAGVYLGVIVLCVMASYGNGYKQLMKESIINSLRDDALL